MGDSTRILLTGGGSGGHVYPLLAVAEALRKLGNDQGLHLELYYVGPKDEYTKILAKVGIEARNIPAAKLRRYLSIENIFDIPKFFFGLIAAFWTVFWMMPDAIFSKGGTGAFSVVVAGWVYRIPIIIHESDAAPGLTNLLSARFASRIALSFETALPYFNPKKTALVGAPVRRELLTDRPTPEAAKEQLGFNPQEPLMLILGGSQGSERINQFILTNLESISKETQILHQTGSANYKEAEKLSRVSLMNVPVKTASVRRYEAVPYFPDNLKMALAAADLVVARAGSGTITEIAAFGKPAILIPLEGAANDHQRINAYEFAKMGAAVVIEEENLLPAIFLRQVKSILADAALRQKMSSASTKFFKPGAAEVIAQEVLRLAS